MSPTSIETSASAWLRTLGRSQATGELTATQDRLVLRIVIDRGSPIFASSNDVEDRLHGVLLRDDYLSIVQLAECVKLMLRERKRLGSILIRESYMRRKQLERALRIQYARIVCRVLTTPDLSYEFTPGPPMEEDVVLHGPANSWIRRAFFQVTEYRRILDAIGGISAVYTRTPTFRKEVAEAQFDPDTLRELYSSGVQTTVKDFCDISAFGDFDALRLIWVLLEINAFERTE